MDKIKNNIENNLAIYLLIITVLVVFLIITSIGNKEKEELTLLDTSTFNVVNSKTALELFNEKEPQLLIIGSKKCSATQNFVPILQISQAKEQYYINYLELTDEDPSSKSYKYFVDKLDIPYVYNNEEKELKEYMGRTPMIIIIKNKKIVYGSIGSMSENALTQLTNTYGVSNEKS